MLPECCRHWCMYVCNDQNQRKWSVSFQTTTNSPKAFAGFLIAVGDLEIWIIFSAIVVFEECENTEVKRLQVPTTHGSIQSHPRDQTSRCSLRLILDRRMPRSKDQTCCPGIASSRPAAFLELHRTWLMLLGPYKDTHQQTAKFNKYPAMHTLNLSIVWLNLYFVISVVIVA